MLSKKHIIIIASSILTIVLGLFTLRDEVSQTNIYCSKDNNKCILTQEILNIAHQKIEFQISDIDNIKLNEETYSKFYYKKPAIKYNIVINFKNVSQPLQYPLSSSVSDEKINAIHKSSIFIKNFNDFITNPQQSTFTNNIENNFIYGIITIFIILFILAYSANFNTNK